MKTRRGSSDSTKRNEQTRRHKLISATPLPLASSWFRNLSCSLPCWGRPEGAVPPRWRKRQWERVGLHIGCSQRPMPQPHPRRRRSHASAHAHATPWRSRMGRQRPRRREFDRVLGRRQAEPCSVEQRLPSRALRGGTPGSLTGASTGAAATPAPTLRATTRRLVAPLPSPADRVRRH